MRDPRAPRLTVRTPPADLDDAALVRLLADAWNVRADAIEYSPVGFGSHHWEARRGPQRWFVTVDDLDTKLVHQHDDRTAALGRLNAALTTARALRDRGHTWVVAPVASTRGRIAEPVETAEPVGDRFVCALYPFVDGRTGSWGRYSDADERRAVVALLAELHRAEGAADLPAPNDDHVIARRDALEHALHDVDEAWTSGPFGEPARALLATHRDALPAALRRYDELTEAVRRNSSLVVTHGEPHRGNAIMTADGPVLIDWDTARLAPAERDLWSLIAEDPSTRRLYESLSGSALDDAALTLYRLSWDLCEIALYIDDFRRPHDGTEDTAIAWTGLTTHLDPSRWNDILAP